MSPYIWTIVFARQARSVRCRTSLDKEMLVVCVGGGYNDAPSNPHTHHSTPTDLYPTVHHARSLDSDSDPNNNVKTTHPVTTHSGRVLTYYDRVRTVGMELDYSWSFVPFQAVCVHSEFSAGTRSSTRRRGCHHVGSERS